MSLLGNFDAINIDIEVVSVDVREYWAFLKYMVSSSTGSNGKQVTVDPATITRHYLPVHTYYDNTGSYVLKVKIDKTHNTFLNKRTKNAYAVGPGIQVYKFYT